VSDDIKTYIPEIEIGKKEIAQIKDAAAVFWKDNTDPKVEGDRVTLENMAMIEGTIAMLNGLGLLVKLPKFKYTHKR
jgi:hypothetical protein